MSREIKFRIWDEIGNKMLKHHEINESWFWAGKFGDFAPMQYTGLKDKNGKEIYEGDIVNVDNSEIDENGEYDVTTVCKWDNGCFVLEDYAGGHWTRQLFHKPHRLTIIGNIYETPELLTLTNPTNP